MGKFVKLLGIVTLIAAFIPKRTEAGRRPSFTRGVVLGTSPAIGGHDGLIHSSPGIDGPGGLPHQDQAFVVGAGYKVSDGVLDGSFGGMGHAGLKYGYDHEGPHHNPKLLHSPYELEFNDADSGPSPAFGSLGGKGFDITHAKGYSVHDDGNGQLTTYHHPTGFGYQYFHQTLSSPKVIGVLPESHQQHQPLYHNQPSNHGRGHVHQPYPVKHHPTELYHYPHVHHHGHGSPHPPSHRPLYKRHYPHPMALHSPPRRHPPYYPHPMAMDHHPHDFPPYAHRPRPARFAGFRGYGNYSPSFRNGLSHSPNHRGYGYIG